MVIDPTTPTREINRRLLLSLHQDGLLDILAGLIVATFGLIPILDQSGLGPGLRQVIILLFYGVSVFLVFWLKRRITLPRAGYVKLSRKTTSRISIILLIINVLLFLLFAGVYIFDIPVWDYFGSYKMSVPLGLIFLIMLTVTGGLLKAARFHFYGLLVLGSFVGAEYLYNKGSIAHHGIPLAAFVSGGVIIAIGIGYLINFLKKYNTD